MKEEISLLNQLRDVIEACQTYNQQAQIQLKIASLKSTISSYSEEAKRLYWRCKVLQDIFSEKTDIGNTDSEILLVFEQTMKKLYDDPNLSQIESTEKTISNLTISLQLANEKLFEVLQGKDKEIQRIMSAKMSAGKIKDLVGPSMFTTSDQDYYMKEIRTKLFNPTGEDINKDLNMLQKTWKTFHSKLKSAPSFDLLRTKYKLSDDTIKVIERLVSGGEITLWELNPKVLTELKTLGRFSTTIIVRSK